MWTELASLAHFERVSRNDRRRLAGALAARLGDAWSAADGSEDLDALPLIHQPTGLEFVAVPGGSFDMGLRDDDLAELAHHIDWTPEFEAWYLPETAPMRPVHRVRVSPFLVARAWLSHQEVDRVSAGRFRGLYCYLLGRDDSRALARTLGFRLVSEAELEWLARDGDRYHFTLDGARRHKETGGDSRLLRSRFGILDIFEQQWTEDDHHPDYHGAPTDSSPWMDGDPAGQIRAWGPPEMIEEPTQLCGLLAAARAGTGYERAAIRLALPLDPPA